jgi:hypothetical protein
VDTDNHQLTFRENGAGQDCIAQIAIGNYDASSMLSALQTAMNAASAATGTNKHYTCSLSGLTAKVTISCNEGNPFIIRAAAAHRGLNQMLGYSMSSDSLAQTPNVAPRIFQSARYENIYLQCSLVNPSSSYVTCTNGQLGVLQEIPSMCIPFGSVYNYQAIQGGWKNLANNALNGVSNVFFRLISEEGTPVPLNGSYWVARIEVD